MLDHNICISFSATIDSIHWAFDWSALAHHSTRAGQNQSAITKRIPTSQHTISFALLFALCVTPLCASIATHRIPNTASTACRVPCLCMFVCIATITPSYQYHWLTTCTTSVTISAARCVHLLRAPCSAHVDSSTSDRLSRPAGLCAQRCCCRRGAKICIDMMWTNAVRTIVDAAAAAAANSYIWIAIKVSIVLYVFGKWNRSIDIHFWYCFLSQ